MRLLQVIAELRSGGGAERIVVELAGDATGRGDRVAIAAVAPAAPHPGLASSGAEFVAVPASGRRPGADMARWVDALRRLLRRFRPDVVHAHNVRATVAARAALLAAGSGAPLICTVHGLAPADYPAATRLLRGTRARVVACAPSVARSLAGHGFPAGAIDVVINGATLAPAGPERIAAVRSRLGIGTGRVVVGVGRLAAQKSWGTLIEAAQSLPPDVAVVVAGDGALADELRSAAREQGGRVRFVGLVEDVAALLGLAHCLVSTSTWEGLPLALLEALSLGVPAVVTAVDGVLDVVADGVALLVPPSDPGATAAAVAEVLSDNTLARRLSEGGRAASAAWTTDRMLADYRRLYDDACARRWRVSRSRVS